MGGQEPLSGLSCSQKVKACLMMVPRPIHVSNQGLGEGDPVPHTSHCPF